jgi:crotonobetainyl-CoA:carnitine CoA-transferase CaiB-like acyl-CoA transferase
MDNLGLGYDTLSRSSQGLLSASAFGRNGAWSDYIGYHSSVNAFSGLLNSPAENGHPRLLGAVLPDTSAVSTSRFVPLALYHYRRTGKVDTSIFHARRCSR